MADPSSLFVIIIVCLIIAITLDIQLMRWLKKRYARNRAREQAIEGVYFLGDYSPVLTWLRNLIFLKRRKQTAEDSDGMDIHQENNTSVSDSHSPISMKNVGIPELPGKNWVEWLERQGSWLQVFILTLSVLIYTRGILNFQAGWNLPGNESDMFQSVPLVLINSLRDFHQFPLWNAYIHTGLPYVADPMLHIYNPVVTLPVFLFGVRNGYKLALVISFWLAAIGMWKLSRVTGLGKIPSLWAGLMYTFAGQPVARFFQGEYLFILGFPWIPWILTALYLFLTKRERRYFIYTAFAVALLYFSGNAYYIFLMSFLVFFFYLTFSVRLKLQKPYLQIDRKNVLSFLVLAIFCLGLVAIHFFPLIQFRPWMSKGSDVQGSHTLAQIVLDFTSKDTFRPDAYKALPAREEFYAYIGFLPFLGLILLPIILWKRDKKVPLFLLITLVFVYVWIDVDHMPWKEFFYNTAFFNQFRHVLRPLIFGSFSLILLTAIGFDLLWKSLSSMIGSSDISLIDRLNRGVKVLALAVILLVFGFSLRDVYATNQPYVSLVGDTPQADVVTKWLREYDDSEYYVRHNPVNSWLFNMLSARLRYIDAWYHWGDIRKFDDQINTRPVEAKPRYVIQATQDPAPDEGDFQWVTEVAGYDIYQLNDSLPISFRVNAFQLQQKNEEGLKRSEVIPLTPYFHGNQKVEIIAEGENEDVLVLLVTKYPGWNVSIDGEPAELLNVSGYMAVEMDKGIHKYVFQYHSTPFTIGGLVSLLSFFIGMAFLAPDFKRGWNWSVNTWRKLRSLRLRTKAAKPKAGAVQPVYLEAIYSHHGIELAEPLNLPEQTRITVLGIPLGKEESPLVTAWYVWKAASLRLLRTLANTLSLPGFLFLGGGMIYLVVRLIGLTQFPIYFFTDEAIQTVSAADLVRDHFFSPDKIFLPTYFKNGAFYNLSLSVYAQVIPYLLFGKSIFVTRLVPVVLSLIGTIILALSLKKTISPRNWWSAVLILSSMPAWFLHSRTAFETVLFCTFYAAYIGGYLLYRQISPRYIYLVVIMGALSFYSYSPGQVVLAVTTLGLFLSDLRYHIQNRRYLIRAMVLALVCAYPYFRFLGYHRSAPLEHLQNLNSYWTYPIPITEKIFRYVKEYFHGLSPWYWFVPNQSDLIRHVMKGYGHIGYLNSVFVLIGFISLVWRYRNPAARVVLIGYLAAPTGGALVGIGITRVLVMVIPMTIMAVVGVDEVFKLFERIISHGRQNRISRLFRTSSLQVGLFILLVLINGYTLVDSLQNSPTWYEDYGLYGMQYGAKQVFGELIPKYLRQNQQIKMLVSSSWANGTDVFVRFFLTDAEASRVQMGSIDTVLSQKQEITEYLLFLLTPEEFRQALTSPKMRYLGLVDQITYPNGRTGFYLVRLGYVDNVDRYFEAEKQARKRLLSDTILINGIETEISFSQIDSGSLKDVFDGDVHSLIRGLEANPFIFDLRFAQPIQVKGFQADFGSMDFELRVTVFTEANPQGVTFSKIYRGYPPDPHIEFLFPNQLLAQKIKIEIKSLSEGETAKIHIREIKFIQ